MSLWFFGKLKVCHRPNLPIFWNLTLKNIPDRQQCVQFQKYFYRGKSLHPNNKSSFIHLQSPFFRSIHRASYPRALSNCIHHLQLPIFRSIQYPTIPYSSIQSSITSIYPFFRSIQYPTIQYLQYIQSFITSNYHSSGLYSIVPSHICSSIQSSITSNPHSWGLSSILPSHSSIQSYITSNNH